MTLPKEFVDAHHHFLDTGNNEFQSFVGQFLPNMAYLASDYQKDVVLPLKEAGVELVGSVHIECMPSNEIEEVEWVEKLSQEGDGSVVKAIVGPCDLTKESVDDDLKKLKAASPSNKLVGIRWILDCVGKFEPNTATHVATMRHDGIDYLRGSNGADTYDGDAVPEFEKGFALLAKHGLSFDLQCAPAQLKKAAELFARHPGVPVVIDHLGKPRMLLGPDDDDHANNTTPDETELATWREGMKAVAAVPNVYVKVSMLGYAVPGWIKTPERTALVKSLARETVELFGPKRCMVALNWWKDGPISDSDGNSSVGPGAVEFLEHMSSFFEDYSDEDKELLFSGTAKSFYKI